MAELEPIIPIDPTISGWPGASPLATACFINMGMLFSRVSARVEALVKAHGIPSTTAFNILTILDGDDEPLLPSVVAARLVMTRGTVTAVVDSLVKHGFVERQPDARDGRMRRLRLTPKGRESARTVRGELHIFENQLIGSLDEETQRTLLAIVARLQHRALADTREPSEPRA